MILKIDRLREEFCQRADALFAWLESQVLAEDRKPRIGKRHHDRLEVFMREYQAILGKSYQVANPVREGGAAKRSEVRVDNETYLHAVRAYLTKTHSVVVESSDYINFIRDLSTWAS